MSLCSICLLQFCLFTYLLIYHFAFNIPANQVAAAQDYLHRCSIRMLPGPAGEEIVQFPD